MNKNASNIAGCTGATGSDTAGDPEYERATSGVPDKAAPCGTQVTNVAEACGCPLIKLWLTSTHYIEVDDRGYCPPSAYWEGALGCVVKGNTIEGGHFALKLPRLTADTDREVAFITDVLSQERKHAMRFSENKSKYLLTPDPYDHLRVELKLSNPEARINSRQEQDLSSRESQHGGILMVGFEGDKLRFCVVKQADKGITSIPPDVFGDSGKLPPLNWSKLLQEAVCLLDSKESVLDKCYFFSVESKASPPPSVLDFSTLASLADRLESPQTRFDKWLKNQLSTETLAALGSYRKATSEPARLQAALLLDLTKIIQGPLIYEEHLFEGVYLRPETQCLLSPIASRNESLRLNHLILQEACSLNFRMPPPQEGAQAPVSGSADDREHRNLTAALAPPKPATTWFLGLPSIHLIWATGTLQEVLSKGELAAWKWSLTDYFKLFDHLFGAVGELHARGHIHGDLRPANVMYSRKNPYSTGPVEPDRFFVIDYGAFSKDAEARQGGTRASLSDPTRGLHKYRTSLFYAPERRSGSARETADTALIIPITQTGDVCGDQECDFYLLRFGWRSSIVDECSGLAEKSTIKETLSLGKGLIHVFDASSPLYNTSHAPRVLSDGNGPNQQTPASGASNQPDSPDQSLPLTSGKGASPLQDHCEGTALPLLLPASALANGDASLAGTISAPGSGDAENAALTRPASPGSEGGLGTSSSSFLADRVAPPSKSLQSPASREGSADSVEESCGNVAKPDTGAAKKLVLPSKDKLERGDRLRIHDSVFEVLSERAIEVDATNGVILAGTTYFDRFFLCAGTRWRVFHERVVLKDDASVFSGPTAIAVPQMLEIKRWAAGTDLYSLGTIMLYAVLLRDLHNRSPQTPSGEVADKLLDAQSEFSQMLDVMENNFFFQTVWEQIEDFRKRLEDDHIKPCKQQGVSLKDDIARSVVALAEMVPMLDSLHRALDKNLAHVILFFHFVLCCIHRRSDLITAPESRDVEMWRETLPYCKDRLEMPTDGGAAAAGRRRLNTLLGYFQHKKKYFQDFERHEDLPAYNATNVWIVQTKKADLEKRESDLKDLRLKVEELSIERSRIYDALKGCRFLSDEILKRKPRRFFGTHFESDDWIRLQHESQEVRRKIASLFPSSECEES